MMMRKSMCVVLMLTLVGALALAGGDHVVYATASPTLDVMSEAVMANDADPRGLPFAALVAARAAAAAARNAAVRRAVVQGGKWVGEAIGAGFFYDYFFGGYMPGEDEYVGVNEAMVNF